MSIADNIARVQSHIDEAAERSGRSPSDVTLIAVSKGFGVEAISEAAAAGHRVFGENRVQETAEKVPVLPDSLEWHMIGHIQSNKAKQAAALFDIIQSVDGNRMAEALARQAASLIAVSKGFGVEAISEAAAVGHTAFGENRVQEAAEKVPVLPDSLEWHMIGHIQSNKAKQAAALFDIIQSVDGNRMAEALARQAASLNRCIPILLQVNVTGKESQFGILPSELPTVARTVAAHTTLRFDGLMTIASFTSDEAILRTEFQMLRQLRDELQSILPDHPCRELSMGMTNDYAIAIEEGATIVRVGRAIFGERPPPEPRGESVGALQIT